MTKKKLKYFFVMLYLFQVIINVGSLFPTNGEILSPLKSQTLCCQDINFLSPGQCSSGCISFFILFIQWSCTLWDKHCPPVTCHRPACNVCSSLHKLNPTVSPMSSTYHQWWYPGILHKTIIKLNCKLSKTYEKPWRVWFLFKKKQLLDYCHRQDFNEAIESAF